MNRAKAFTLIELLIVVAIIAILAAIAVPNFLEAQTRAKVARVKADMRTITTGLETYHIDHGIYIYQIPQWRALRINNNQPLVLERLTTPIAYLNGVSSFTDPFISTKLRKGAQLANVEDAPSNKHQNWIFQLYKYYARNETNPAIENAAAQFQKKPLWYILGSAGPDGVAENLNEPLTTRPNNTDADMAFFLDETIYDSSNGTISNGSLYRVGGVPSGVGTAFYRAAQTAMN